MFKYSNPEPVRYKKGGNNGSRKRLLALGAYNAGIINAARQRDFEVVLAAVKEMGGVCAPKNIARTLIKAAKKLPSDVSKYVVVSDPLETEFGIPYRKVFIPVYDWEYEKGKQIGVIKWLPVWGVCLSDHGKQSNFSLAIKRLDQLAS